MLPGKNVAEHIQMSRGFGECGGGTPYAQDDGVLATGLSARPGPHPPVREKQLHARGNVSDRLCAGEWTFFASKTCCEGAAWNGGV